MNMTKKELKEFLDSHNTNYKYADTISILREKVLALIKGGE